MYGWSGIYGQFGLCSFRFFYYIIKVSHFLCRFISFLLLISSFSLARSLLIPYALCFYRVNWLHPSIINLTKRNLINFFNKNVAPFTVKSLLRFWYWFIVSYEFFMFFKIIYIIYVNLNFFLNILFYYQVVSLLNSFYNFQI